MTKQPTHFVYHVKEKEIGGKGVWQKLGAAWPHQDGKGFSLELELLPVNHGDTMKLTLREATVKPDSSSPESSNDAPPAP